jgi:hypothetical protein
MTRFLGVAYQLTPHDPLIDNEQCKLDAALMKELGANTIRVYHVDENGDHKDCMDTFADAGIYLFVDLDTFSTQIEPVRVVPSPVVSMLTCSRSCRTGIPLSSPRSRKCLMSSSNSIIPLVSLLVTRS